MRTLLATTLALVLSLTDSLHANLPITSSLVYDGTNQLSLTWIAVPGSIYALNTSTNLLQPWQPTPGQPATFSTNGTNLTVFLLVDASARFFQVVRLDTQGPEIYQTSPQNNAVGVSPEAILQAWLKDETGVNTNTIQFSVGTNPPVTLSDPRLTWSTNGVLTYSPATNEVLGGLGQAVTARLSVADVLGNLTTNFTWSFQLALSNVVTTNIVVLEAVPSILSANQIGATQQLRIFTEQGMIRTEVTLDPATLFASADSNVVSIDSLGLMTFTGQGSTEITANFNGLTANSQVTVVLGGTKGIGSFIGPAGGDLTFADGTGVHIPSGALLSGESIQVETMSLPANTMLPPTGTVVGSAYAFSPDGMLFAKPVEISLGYGGATIPPGYDEESALIHLLYPSGHLDVEALTGPPGEEDLVETVGQSVDLENKIVTSSTYHFSDRALVMQLSPTAVTLTAPDNTTLPILRYLKTEKPSPGPDGKWGLPGCDDNGDGVLNDVGEFEMNGRPPGPKVSAECVASPTLQNDDLAVAIPTRPASGITYIVLHSTAGATSSQFKGEVSWAASRRNLYWAHYYVGKDGTIVQVSQDTDIANHIKGNNVQSSEGYGINANNAIGIEIFNNVNGVNYPGRQVAAVVRLCDFLIRMHPGIVRPSAAAPTGNIITHADQDATPGRKKDPTGQFRPFDYLGNVVMGPVSLQEIVMLALRQDGFQGLINTKGGDALGAFAPGQGGDVTIEAGLTSLEDNYVDSRRSINVAANQTVQFAGPNQLMHLLVKDSGTLVFNAAANLDLDGILYVGPQATLDLRGGFDGGDARSLTITSDGFALILGRVLLNGTDKLSTTELAPFNQAPFPASGTGLGRGGKGANFSFRTAAPGPIWVPTIVTRGGDANVSTSTANYAGGNGGAVLIHAASDGQSDPVYLHVEGYQQSASDRPNDIGLPDTMPPPPPFNFMPIVASDPIGIASGTCASPFATTPFMRPVFNERLAIGRIISGTTRAWGDNISFFTRGIITVGGTGAYSPSNPTPAAAGGNAGSLTIKNDTTGFVRFVGGPALFTGSGAESLATVIYIAGSTCFEFYRFPTGGLGGFGSSNGASGGNAGNIEIGGIIYPNLMPVAPANSSVYPVYGFDQDNPNFSGGQQIGKVLRFPNEGFTVGSSAGSGGSAGGGGSFPGFFGPRGANGTTVINGQSLYP